MSYNLDLDNAEYFEFVLKGHTYRMRYPSPADLKEIAELKDVTLQNERVFSFIEAVSEGAPPLSETLNTLPINIVNRFNTMVTDEFMGNGNGG